MWLSWLGMNLILMGWCCAVLSVSAVAASVPDPILALGMWHQTKSLPS